MKGMEMIILKATILYFIHNRISIVKSYNHNRIFI